MKGDDQEGFLRGQFNEAVDDFVQAMASDGTRGQALAEHLREQFSVNVGLEAPLKLVNKVVTLFATLMEVVDSSLLQRKEEMENNFPALCRFLILDTIDRRWKDHLYGMDHLRAAIGLEVMAKRSKNAL